jgi:hypothetical protein
MTNDQESKIRSVLLAVKNRRLSLEEAQRALVALLEERENLIFESVKLVVTELEREVQWLKDRRV